MPGALTSSLLAALLWLGQAAAGKGGDRPVFNRHTGLFEPPFSELERAVEHGDRADVARWAARIGPARLAEALRGADRAKIVAALEAVELLPGNVRLLEAVAPLAAAGDAAVGERAIRALGQMLDGSEPRRIEDWDIPADAVARACRTLTDVAARATAPVDLRLAAIDALAGTTLVCKPVPLTLLSDGQPAIRRAALLAQRPRDELPAPALKQALGDGDPTVVAAAAVAWCRHRLVAGARAPSLLGRLIGGSGGPEPPVRDLAAAEITPLEDAIELVPCLAASTEAADRQALEQLRKSKNPLLRARATEVATAGGR
jgi:hypothetical protein